jgi:hypothetical protein
MRRVKRRGVSSRREVLWRRDRAYHRVRVVLLKMSRTCSVFLRGIGLLLQVRAAPLTVVHGGMYERDLAPSELRQRFKRVPVR